MTPLTSFLMPARDAADTIDAAIASVLAQTEDDFELVLVDDGSNDDTLDRALQWQLRDPRVRLIRQPPLGIVPALQAGLAASRGKWIARMDADDVASPDRLRLQLPLLADNRVVDGQVQFFRDDQDVPAGMERYADWVNGICSPADFDRELLVESPVVHPAATFARTTVLDAGGYRNGAFPEDYDLWLRLHAAGVRFHKVETTLVRMRDRPQRLTRIDPRYGRDAFRVVRQRWLSMTHLRRPRSVALWGAGKECRPWLRWLLDNGHQVPLIIDIDPKKIGRTRRDIPILGPEALAKVHADFCLVLVAARGARAPIRSALGSLRPHWREGQHWWAVR